MNVFDLFDPAEVKAMIALFDIERRKAADIMLSMGYELVRPGIRQALKANPSLLKDKLYEEKIELRTLLYLMVVNECGLLMQSGRYHSGFGGHLMQGDALIALWYFGAEQLQDANYWNEENARAARETFRQQCTT